MNGTPNVVIAEDDADEYLHKWLAERCLQAVPDDVFHEAQKVILHREDNMAHRIAKQIADDAQERLFKALDWFYGDRVSGHVEESRESAVKVCDIMVEILGHEHFRRRFLGERKLEQEEEVGDL